MGQNLIRRPYEFEKYSTSADSIFTLNEDGSITANGTTGDSTAYCSLCYFGTLAGGNVGDVVTLTGCPVGGGRDTYYINIVSNSIGGDDTGSGFEFTITEEELSGTSLQIDIVIAPNVTVDNLVFKPYIGDVSAADKLVTIAENERAVHKAGQKSEYDRFWDNLQDYGNRTDYWGAFCGWNDEMFKPKYPFVMINHGYAFRYSTITAVPEIEIRNTPSMVQLFYDAKMLRRVEKLSFNRTITSFSNTFNNCEALEHIIIDGVIAANVSFAYSPLLDEESRQSIIDCLADLTGKTAQTLTLHATVGAKLTDAQKATITAKNWTLVY